MVLNQQENSVPTYIKKIQFKTNKTVAFTTTKIQVK